MEPGQDDAAQAITSSNSIIDQLREPLQEYMLPWLTADAIAALHRSCRAMHQLLVTAEFPSTRSALEGLLAPQIRYQANTKANLQFLLASQAALKRCMQDPAAPVRVQPLKLRPTESAWDPRWAPESPCQSLLLDCKNKDYKHRQMVLDPSNPRACEKQALTRWLNQHLVWRIHCFLEKGTLLVSRSAGFSLALLDVGSSNILAQWGSVYQSIGLRPPLGEKFIFVEQSIATAGLRYSFTVRSVTVLDQHTLRELSVLPAPALRSTAVPAGTVRCYSIQPSPDERHLAIIWRSEDYARNPHAQSLQVQPLQHKMAPSGNFPRHSPT